MVENDVGSAIGRLRDFYHLIDSGFGYTETFKKVYKTTDGYHNWDLVDQDQEMFCRWYIAGTSKMDFNQQRGLPTD